MKPLETLRQPFPVNFAIRGHFFPPNCTFLHCIRISLRHKGSYQIFFNEINGLEHFREKIFGLFPLKIRHLEKALKVTPEGSNKLQKPQKMSSGADKKKPLREGHGLWGCGQTQSPNIFCLSSRRCCASSDSVAVGRASRRPTPIGSPVSSQ